MPNDPAPTQIGTFVLIHGLPTRDPGADPRLQLATIESRLSPVLPRILYFDWGAGFLDTYHLLTDGRFGEEMAEKFDPWFRDNTQNLQRLVVVAYSLGGLIFYKWVTNLKTRPEDRAKVSLAVTIASPYQCLLGAISIEATNGRILTLINIREPPVSPADILKYLPPRTLKILLPENDITILPHDSSFTNNPYVQHSSPPVFEERIIGGATHNTICDHPNTLNNIVAFCDNLS